MSFKTFIPKIPLALGVVTGGMTWLAVVFFLVTGMFGGSTKKAEFYVQQPQIKTAASLFFQGVPSTIIGQSVPVRIVLNTGGKAVLGVDTQIKVIGVAQIDITNTDLFEGNYPLKGFSGDTINISAFAKSPTSGVNGNDLTVAVLNIQSNNPGQVRLEFTKDPKYTQVIDTSGKNLLSQKLADYSIDINTIPSPSLVPLLSPLP